MDRRGMIATLLGLSVACAGPADTAEPARMTAAPVSDRASDVVELTAGFGTPYVDGVMRPGEWDGAGALGFQANLPAWEGGGTATATLFAMNDETNLYLAFRLRRSGPARTGLSVTFAADRVCHDFQDVVGANFGPFDVPFTDAFRRLSGNLCVGPGDTQDGGTTDGGAASSYDGTDITIEFFHPLRSGDVHDIALSPGDADHLWFDIRTITYVPGCPTPWPEGQQCYGDTSFPGPLPNVVHLSTRRGLDLSVRSARIVLPQRDSTGMAQLAATFVSSVPDGGDGLSLSVDGSTLFSAPFGAFSRVGNGKAYMLLRKGVLAWLDFEDGNMFVVAPGVGLPGFDPSDGVPVELRIGTGLGRETIEMAAQGRFGWRYERAQACEVD